MVKPQTTVQELFDAVTQASNHMAQDDLNTQEDQLDLVAMSRRIVTLQAEISQREDEIDDIKARILKARQPGTYQAGDLEVQVRAGAARLDSTRFQKAFPAKEHPTFYKLALNTPAIKKAISEDDLAAYQTQGKPSVVVK